MCAASLAQESHPLVYEQKPVNLAWPIAYVREVNGQRSLWVVGGVLAERTKLSGTLDVLPELEGGQPALAWSPDGRRLAFVAQEKQGQQIFICDVRLRTLRSVLRGVERVRVTYLDWSPDGKYLAFGLRAMRGAATTSATGAYVCTATGRIVRKVSGNVRAGRTRWSPDGARLAFVGFSQNLPAIFTVSPRSTNPRRVAGTENIVGSFAWSPGGEYFAFEGKVGNGPGRAIFVIPSEGGQPAKIAAPVAHPRLAGWARGEPLVAFSGARPDGLLSVFVARPPWGQAEDIVAPLGAEFAAFATSFAERRIFALWAPQGTKLAFIAGPADQQLGKYLYVWTPGKGAEQVSRPIEVHDFRWFADGQRLLVVGRRSAVGRLAPGAYLCQPGAEPEEIAPNVVAYGLSPRGAILATLHVANVQGTHVLAARTIADRKLQWIDRDVVAFAFGGG